MIVCPVCEHEQAHGAECDVCGRIFGARPTAVPASRLADVEFTAHAPVARVAAEAFPELERGREAKVDAPIDSVPDLDTGRHDAGARATRAAPAPPRRLCRYCRSPQPTGAFCDACGMRMPPDRALGEGEGSASIGERPKVRHGCGELTLAGGPCEGCGVPVPLP